MSTPHDPDGPANEGEAIEGYAPPPSAPAVPPTAMPSGPPVPSPPVGHPPAPLPYGQPPSVQQGPPIPVPPHPVPQQFGPYGQPPWQAGPAPRPRSSIRGPHVAIGAGVGIVVVILVFLAAPTLRDAGHYEAPFWILGAAVPVSGILTVVPPPVRGIALGMAIVFASFWVTLIGPCLLVFA